jgi:hypothetical protein
MKGKLLFAAALLALSSAASCATLTDGVDAQFFAQNGTLALKIKNNRKDMPVHIGNVSLLLSKKRGQKSSEVVYQTAANVDVGPGRDATVTLLPVKQLATAMQKHSDAPTNGYSEILVDNTPGTCGACTARTSYNFKSVGFGAQAEASFNGGAIKTNTLFGGYLVFLAK